MSTRLRFATDEDLLRFEPSLDKIWPRMVGSTVVRNWDVQHALAMDELARRMRARKSQAEPFELGALSPASQERLRDVVACFALAFIYAAADTQGDAAGFLPRKHAFYWERAREMLEAEAMALDYDSNRDGVVDVSEKAQPSPVRFIRG